MPPHCHRVMTFPWDTDSLLPFPWAKPARSPGAPSPTAGMGGERGQANGKPCTNVLVREKQPLYLGPLEARRACLAVITELRGSQG